MEEIKNKYIGFDELIKLYEEGKKVCIWGAGYLGKTTGKDVLKKIGVKPFCFCDNNRELIGTIVYGDVECKDYLDFLDNVNEYVFIICVRIAIQDDIYIQLRHYGFEYIIPITDISGDERLLRQYFPFMNEKTVAYTCVVNNYDKIHYPNDSVADKYDFYYISDVKPPELGNFKGWIDIREVCPSEIDDYTRMNRYCKINAHKLFSEYDRSIYFDGCVQIRKNFDEVFDRMPPMGFIPLSQTGHIDLYREAVHKIVQTVEKEETIYAQIKKYWMDGFPRNFGSWFCPVLVRKHNTIRCKKLMQDWWEQICEHSKRDQLSLPYVLWKNGYTSSDVVTILQDDEKLEDNQYMRMFPDHLRKL